jgi:hypothetical protein
MHSRLIFLHPVRRFDSVIDVFPKQSLRLVVEVSQDRGQFDAEVCGGRTEKNVTDTKHRPVLKLTQVGEESILRRSRELRLRN